MAKVKAVKRNGKRKAALILSILALAFLIANAIYYFAAKENILTRVTQSINQSLQQYKVPEEVNIAILTKVPVMLFVIATIWLALALLMAWTTWLLERSKGRWYILLILGIVSLLTLRLETGIAAIISSILYKS